MGFLEQTVLVLIAVISFSLGATAWFYARKLRADTLKHNLETQRKELELKRQVLELQVLRSLNERAGYSLDLQQILEVITDSLGDLIPFSSVAYMLPSPGGRVALKFHLKEPVSRSFVEQGKAKMLAAFSAMKVTDLQANMVDEVISGSVVDNSLDRNVESFFNLPFIVNGTVAALINVSSSKLGLYGDEETTVLYSILNQVSSSASKLSQVVENEKRKLSAMIGSLTDGIVMTDPTFKLVVANKALEMMLNLPKEVDLHHIVGAVRGSVDLEKGIEQALYHQECVKLPEFELNNKAIQIDVEPVKDINNSLLGAAVVFHDVTETRQLERLKEEFTAMMVHELRTPLTTISYSTDMMIEDLTKLSSDQVSKNLTIIKSTAANMLSLVNELLDIAKIEAGKFQIVKQPDDLGMLITEKAAAFQSLAQQKQLKLTTEIDANLPAISFDRRRIGQVIDNLLSNAFKYTSSGQITIKAVVEGIGQGSGRVLVSIIDTGEGIKSEDLPKLFSKFEQLGKGKTGEKGGTGLGLVVTKGIIEAHGGTIWVNSKGSGQGTTFTFSLPLK